MRRSESGFTLIELLIVVGIIGTLAAVLLPRVLESRNQTNVFADQQQLSTHYKWLELYKLKHRGSLPSKGGYQFVMAPWTSRIFDHTVENLDMYFTPGWRADDSYWQEAREALSLGEEPWPDLGSTSPDDTHYVGRAKKHLRTANQGAGEAWMATDNEGGWVHPMGDINILMNGGSTRTYSYQELVNLFGLEPFDRNQPPIETYGPNSPIEECQKLDN